ncbi:TetR family transcriptional regulator [Nonomuraea wenchangensis]|uniref:TetR family transcriptional regulator n=1 Tax=Nonomuraea wenchangensis TaxID=568860 RepID=UPI002481AA8D|nr:TetR family transcriptional regulator [Nonomuraea wenchangensis]
MLAAAREIFVERGYERTTIRAVAAAAGVNAGRGPADGWRTSRRPFPPPTPTCAPG